MYTVSKNTDREKPLIIGSLDEGVARPTPITAFHSTAVRSECPSSAPPASGVALLRAFVATLPADRKYTIEFRHETWFTHDVFAILRERDIAMCVVEQPEFASPVVATATWGYLRFHKFDYDAASLAARGRPDQGAGVERGVRVLQARRGRGVGAAGGGRVRSRDGAIARAMVRRA